MARFYKTPYVQNIPDYGYELPFNEILAGLNQKQEKFDEVADLPDAINEQLLKITPYFSEDKEALQVYTSNLNKEMDDLIASVNGDYSKLGPQLKKISRKVNSDLNQGDLAQIQSNTEGAKKTLEAKNKLSTDDKGKGWDENYYNAFGSGKAFNEKSNKSYDPSKGVTPYTHEWVHSKAQELDEAKQVFDPLKADLIARGAIDVTTGMTTDKSLKEISMPKIYNAAYDSYKGISPNFKRELDYQFDNYVEQNPDGMINHIKSFEVMRNADFLASITDKNKRNIAIKNIEDHVDQLIDDGNIGALRELYGASYLAELGHSYIFKEDIKKSGFDSGFFGAFLQEEEENPYKYTTDELQSNGQNVLPVNTTDPIIGTVTFDANGQVKTTNGTVKWTLSENDAIKSETGKNYTDLITFTLPDGSTKEVTIDELFVLTDTDVKTSTSDDPFTSVNFNSLVNKAANKYKDYLTSEEYVETVSKKLQESQINLSGDPGSEYDLTPLTQKEFYDLTTDANKNLKQNTQFQSTFKSIGNWAESQSDRILTASNLENSYITTGKGNTTTLKGTAESLGYSVGEFTEVIAKNKISAISYDGSYIVKMPSKDGKTMHDIKIPMEKELQQFFDPIRKIYSAAMSRKPVTAITIPINGNNIQVNVRTRLNKNTRTYEHGYTIVNPNTGDEQDFDLSILLDSYTQNFYKYINPNGQGKSKNKKTYNSIYQQYGTR
jgi:hypothetical protein